MNSKKRNENIKEFRLGELFCGPGGLALGAITAKIDNPSYRIVHQWANDYDADTCIMKVEEYREVLRNDIKLAVKANDSNLEDEFLAYAVGVLINGEEFDDFVECHYEGVTRRNGYMELDGYAKDETDGSICLFIVDYHGEKEADSVKSEEINSCFKKLRLFVEESDYWKKMLDWGINKRLLSEKEKSIVKMVINMNNSSWTKVSLEEMYKLNELRLKTLDLSSMSTDELIDLAQSMKDGNDYIYSAKLFEELIKRNSDAGTVRKILPRYTSILRKLEKPRDAINLYEDYYAQFGKSITSPALYTSLAAAYCDMGDFIEARNKANIAHAMSGGNSGPELISVYARIKSMEK